MRVEVPKIFDVSIEREANHRIEMVVRGNIDSGTVMEFDYHLGDALQRGVTWFIIDVSSVDHVSRAGALRLLMARDHARKAGGDLVIYGATPQVIEVFQFPGLDVPLKFVATREEAQAVLNGQASA